MSTESEVREHNPHTDYERADASPKLVGGLALGLLVTVCTISAVLFAVYPSARAPVGQRQAPTMPEPRLQIDPNAELARLRARETARLESYGWVDSQRGVVHIPIDEAMRRVARQGVPDWPGAR